jgi:hypothetical protein
MAIPLSMAFLRNAVSKLMLCTVPGETVFAVMPYAATSFASDAVIAIMAALAAE